jgi:PEP-CTERM motif
MKLYAVLCASMLLTTVAAQADSITETSGTPSNSSHSPAILTPTPNGGGLIINFDTADLENMSATCVVSSCPSLTVQNVTFSSPDGVQVIPDSDQSFPNELFDTSSIGAANLTIAFATGVGSIGVGIADGDFTSAGAPVTITLEALGAGNTDLGTFNVTIPELGATAGNGYFVVTDNTAANLFGLNITTAGDSTGLDSGLAIDDVQVVPEPSSYLLVASGVALFFCLRKRKLA